MATERSKSFTMTPVFYICLFIATTTETFFLELEVLRNVVPDQDQATTLTLLGLAV